MDREALIGAWRDCIRGADKSWVLFAQGTCVILTQPEPDLAAQARALLAEWGAVRGSTPANCSSACSAAPGGARMPRPWR